MDLCEFEGSLVYIVPVHPRLHSKTLSQEQEQKCFTCTIGLGRINIMEKLKDWFVALSSLRKSCIQDLVTEWDNLKLFSMYKGYSLIHAYSYSFIFIHSLTHSITLSVCLSIPRLLFLFYLIFFPPPSQSIVSLYDSGYPGTSYVNKAGIKLLREMLSFRLLNSGIKCVCG